jgi:hypothetical protein
MGTRIDELEGSIGELMEQAGVRDGADDDGNGGGDGAGGAVAEQ